jgi:hypothetical protein
LEFGQQSTIVSVLQEMDSRCRGSRSPSACGTYLEGTCC